MDREPRSAHDWAKIHHRTREHGGGPEPHGLEPREPTPWPCPGPGPAVVVAPPLDIDAPDPAPRLPENDTNAYADRPDANLADGGTISWIVGVDLDARSHGALAFARWLYERTHALGHRFTGVHVIESRMLATRDYPGVGGRVDRAQALAKGSVRGMRAQYAIPDVKVTTARHAAHGLESYLAETNGGLIVGRADVAGRWSAVSLGSVARRLLRRNRAPICVVPPDLDLAGLDPGPIVVAVQDDPMCVEALRFAMRLGRQIGRPVVGAQGLAPLVAGAMAVAPGVAVRAVTASDGDVVHRRQRTRRRVEQWCTANGLPPIGLRLLDRPPVDAVCRVADQTHACAIVCGAHERSWLDRILHASIGTGIAATANHPVFVIPGRAGAESRSRADRRAG